MSWYGMVSATAPSAGVRPGPRWLGKPGEWAVVVVAPERSHDDVLVSESLVPACHRSGFWAAGAAHLPHPAPYSHAVPCRCRRRRSCLLSSSWRMSCSGSPRDAPGRPPGRRGHRSGRGARHPAAHYGAARAARPHARSRASSSTALDCKAVLQLRPDGASVVLQLGIAESC